jgi:hypothetical protein
LSGVLPTASRVENKATLARTAIILLISQR